MHHALCYCVKSSDCRDVLSVLGSFLSFSLLLFTYSSFFFPFSFFLLFIPFPFPSLPLSCFLLLPLSFSLYSSPFALLPLFFFLYPPSFLLLPFPFFCYSVLYFQRCESEIHIETPNGREISKSTKETELRIEILVAANNKFPFYS